MSVRFAFYTYISNFKLLVYTSSHKRETGSKDVFYTLEALAQTSVSICQNTDSQASTTLVSISLLR